MSPAETTSRFSPRTVRWVLIGSLALNVLIIGAVASAMCMARFGGPPQGRGIKPSPLLGFARTLPRERADIVRQSVADAQPNMENLRRAMRDARAAVRTALTAEPFEQAKLDAAVEEIVQAETNQARARTSLFAGTVGKLTPKERVQLHEWLELRRPIH